MERDTDNHESIWDGLGDIKSRFEHALEKEDEELHPERITEEDTRRAEAVDALGNPAPVEEEPGLPEEV